MRIYKISQYQKSLSTRLLNLIFLIISVYLIYATTIQLLQASNKPMGIIQVSMLTLQSMHNQLYFFLPGLAVSWMILFQKPTHIELFFLTNQNKLGYFILCEIMKTLIIFILAVCVGDILVLLSHPELSVLDLDNLPLGTILLLLHLTGIVCYWSVLAFLSIICNKLLALTIFSLIISIDYWIFNLFSWSLFLSNGLSLASMDYGPFIFSDLCLYLGYILLIYYLQPHIFKRISLL